MTSKGPFQHKAFNDSMILRFYDSLPQNFQGQVGRGSEHPGRVVDTPGHCRRVGLDDF